MLVDNWVASRAAYLVALMVALSAELKVDLRAAWWAD